MYDESKKGDRILAQIDAMDGSTFGFKRQLKKLKEIIMTDEDIYGYLVGYSDEEGRWVLIFCTSYNIYILDKSNLFNVNYTQYDVRAFRGINTEGKNKFINKNELDVTLTIDREIIKLQYCQKYSVDAFRQALNSAKNGGSVPYDFDREPFLEGYNDIEEPVTSYKSTTNYYEDASYEDASSEYEKQKYEPTEEELKKQKELSDFYQDGSYEDDFKNMYIYRQGLNENYGFNNVGGKYALKNSNKETDEVFKEAQNIFKEWTGVKPQYSDVRFYKDLDTEDLKKIIRKNLFKDFIKKGRNGTLFELKKQLDLPTSDEDYISDSESEYTFLNYTEDIEDYRMLNGNHIASRFVSKEIVEKYENDKKMEEESEYEDSSDTADDDLDFNVDLDAVFGKSPQEAPEEDSGEPVKVIHEYNQELPEVKQEPVRSNTDKNPFEEIIAYKELLDKGIITKEEFAYKKKELLGL